MNRRIAALRSHLAPYALVGEAVCLALAAPLLYLPNWMPPGAPLAGLLVLVCIPLWRWLATGAWWTRTWADWPLLLFAALLPLSLWAAPETLRYQYSLPRAAILLWNLSLFGTVVTYASRSDRTARRLVYGLMAAASLVALVAPLGMNWLYKLAFLTPLLNVIPRPLLGLFQGAESGFSPNQVAGTLLYALPLSLTWTVLGFRERRRTRSWWLFFAASLIMGATLILSQSRGALIGLIVGVGIAWLLALPRGPVIAGAAILLAGVSAPFWLEPIYQLAYGGNTYLNSAAMNLDWRKEVWQRAIEAISEFPITGMGLGTFRAASRWLYPFYKVAEGYDVAHAHNLFLQTALDFGVLGLVALLALYCGMVAALLHLAQPQVNARVPHHRLWAIGFASIVCAQTVYSMSDAVAMGSKTNFFFWWLLALVAGFANLAVRPSKAADQA